MKGNSFLVAVSETAELTEIVFCAYNKFVVSNLATG